MAYSIEAQLQADCVKWFHNTYHEYRRMLHANDNNSYNGIEGNKKKAMGVIKGVSDLELICDHGKVIFIELKLPGKTQSAEQIDFEQKILKLGHIYLIIDTLEDFKRLIEGIYGKR